MLNEVSESNTRKQFRLFFWGGGYVMNRIAMPKKYLALRKVPVEQ